MNSCEDFGTRRSAGDPQRRRRPETLRELPAQLFALGVRELRCDEMHRATAEPRPGEPRADDTRERVREIAESVELFDRNLEVHAQTALALGEESSGTCPSPIPADPGQPSQAAIARFSQFSRSEPPTRNPEEPVKEEHSSQ